MIDVQAWLPLIIGRLKQAFASRLLFVGLQGSYRRGEATENSDLDLVVILDRLGPDDLAKYKSILADLPEADKTCGFIAGQKELANWPRYEIFQFVLDTQGYYGQLTAPTPSREDLKEGLKIGTANLYHGLSHSYVHGGDDWPRMLPEAFKSASFLLQLKYYLQHDLYIPRKRDLIDQLDAEEAEILRLYLNWPAREAGVPRDPAQYFQLLFNWSAAILRDFFPEPSTGRDEL